MLVVPVCIMCLSHTVHAACNSAAKAVQDCMGTPAHAQKKVSASGPRAPTNVYYWVC